MKKKKKIPFQHAVIWDFYFIFSPTQSDIYNFHTRFGFYETFRAEFFTYAGMRRVTTRFFNFASRASERDERKGASIRAYVLSFFFFCCKPVALTSRIQSWNIYRQAKLCCWFSMLRAFFVFFDLLQVWSDEFYMASACKLKILAFALKLFLLTLFIFLLEWHLV